MTTPVPTDPVPEPSPLPTTEPLAAPPIDREWRVLWSSEDPKYGGWGTRPWDAQQSYLQGHAAIVLDADKAATGPS